jgi:hypothetical protein
VVGDAAIVSPKRLVFSRFSQLADSAARQSGRFELLPNDRRLKIIKPGMDTHAVVARFEAEHQALTANGVFPDAP